MSWPPGWVIPRVKRAFRSVSPGTPLSTSQIMEWTHPRAVRDGRRPQQYRARTIRRACLRMGLISLGRGERYRDGIFWRMPDD
jgi:hypothetical protein